MPFSDAALLTAAVILGTALFLGLLGRADERVRDWLRRRRG